MTTHVPAIAQEAPAPQSGNKLSAFIGEWTLKNDQFQQVWDGKTVETLKIPNHFTKCDPVNTDGSVLCAVTAGDLNGHILWVSGTGQQVHHLSHFGTERTGVGIGTLDDRSDLTLKISFRDEPEGTYRQYTYSWVSADEYTMMSRQYDKDGRATGNWYGGTFVRLPETHAVQSDIQKVKAILKRIDADITDMGVYSDDVVHMAQGSRAITSKAELQKVLAAEVSFGRSEMTHEIVTIHSYPDIVLTRGRVKGAWHPADGGKPVSFETNNMITFRRASDGSLKVWQVIFNRVELERYQP